MKLTTSDKRPDESIIETAMRRWQLASDAEDKIRKAALDDLKFSMGGENQWPTALFSSRSDDHRPSLTVDKIGPAIKQVTNDQRQNRPSLKIVATDDSTEDEAEVWEGLIRHIQNDSNADIAYATACDHQVRMGFGYFRVVTEYCDERSFDQDIKIKPIKNPFTVYDDPDAQEYDRSDRKWLLITSDIKIDAYKDHYASAGDMALMSIGDKESDWQGSDYIRVAEYFEVVEEPIEIIQVSNGKDLQTVDDERLIPEGYVEIQRRPSTKRKVIWRMINGYEVLTINGEKQEKTWPGKYIPVIGVYGEEIDVDGELHQKGLVRSAKDPQRMLNYYTSAQTEAIALAPKAPFLAAEGQLEGYEDQWRTANVKNYPYLSYRTKDLQGNVVGAPQRQQAEPAIQAMTLALREASDNIKATTGIYDPSLGQNTSDQSGRAIIELNKEGDVQNLHFQDNLARSIRYLGVIVIDLIPHIYDAQRTVRITFADNTGKTVQLNTPFQEDGVQKMYDMSNSKFDITVDVGPSFATKRQAAAEGMINFLSAVPQAAPFIGDLIARDLDFPSSDQIADRLQKMLPPQLQDQSTGNIPPPLKNKMDQMGNMIQQLSQQLHAALDQLDAKTTEMQSKENIAKMANDTKVKIAQLNNESGITEAVINQEGAANMAFVQHQLGMIEGRVDFHRDHFAAQRDQEAAQQNAAQQAELAPEPATPASNFQYRNIPLALMEIHVHNGNMTVADCPHGNKEYKCPIRNLALPAL